MEKEQRPKRERSEIFDLSTNEMSEEEFLDMIQGNIDDINTEIDEPKKTSSKNRAAFLIIYGLAFLFSCTMIYLRFPDNSSTQKAKFVQYVLEKNSPNDVSYSIWGPISIKKAGSQVKLSMDAYGLSPNLTSNLYSYRSEKKENWISGEVNLVKDSIFNNGNGQLHDKQQLLDIINGKSDDNNKSSIIEVFSFPFNLWSYYEKDFYDSYRESETAKDVEFELSEAGTYYILLEHYLQISKDKSQNRTASYSKEELLINLYTEGLEGLAPDSPEYKRKKAVLDKLIKYSEKSKNLNKVSAKAGYDISKNLHLKVQLIHKPIIWFVLSAIVFFILFIINLKQNKNS